MADGRQATGPNLLKSFALSALMTGASIFSATAQNYPEAEDLLHTREKIRKVLSLPEEKRGLFAKKKKSYPADVSGNWPGLLYISPINRRDSLDYTLATLDLEQDGNRVTGDAYYHYINRDSVVFQAHTKLEGTYIKGFLDLKTVDLVHEDSYTTDPNAKWCYDTRISGQFRTRKNVALMDSYYRVESNRAFSGQGEQMIITEDCAYDTWNAYAYLLDEEPVFEEKETDNQILTSRVYFNRSQATLLSKQDTLELERISSLLLRYPDLEASIDGYTESLGSSEANLQLSIRRAKVIRSYFMENGIARRRIQFAGHGKKDPEAPNDCEKNRALNRRAIVTLAVR